MIVFLMVIKSPTGKGNWVVFAVTLFLRQHHTQAFFQSIHLQVEGFCVVSKGQHQSIYQLPFDLLKSSSSIHGEMKPFQVKVGSLTTQVFMQWSSQMGKVLNESPVMTSWPEKCLDLRICIWGWEVNYGLDIFLAWFHPSLRDMMGQIDYFMMEAVALRWFKLQVVLMELVEHCEETLEVLRFHLQIHSDIIQVDDTICQVELPRTILHQPLECCRCIAQSEQHPFALIKT